MHTCGNRGSSVRRRKEGDLRDVEEVVDVVVVDEVVDVGEGVEVFIPGSSSWA